MRTLAVVLSVLLLASFYDEALSQCGSWNQSTFTVGEGVSFLSITAQFSSPVATQTFLQWTTVANTAEAGSDYFGASGILTFNAGESQQNVLLFIIDDADPEVTETFSVELLTIPSGSLCDTATIEILDNEPEEEFVEIVWSQSKYNFSEDDGIVQICAAPSENSATITEITVTNITLEGINATINMDFFLVGPSELVFSPVTTTNTQCISIIILNDSEFEGSYPEVFYASFYQSGANGPQITDVCIVDDDPMITIEWEMDCYEFEEPGTFSVCAVTNDTIIGDRIETRQVVFKNGSAIADVDFDDPDVVQEVVFVAGDSRQCIEIEILDDGIFEMDEYFSLCLESVVPGVEESTTKVIINDDEGDITINVENEIYTVIEGNDLEVCVVIADNSLSTFGFNLTGYFFLKNFYFYIRIYFPVGVSRSCGSVTIPGNTYVDKQEREQEIIFSVEDSEFSEFITFDRFSAWIFFADDDIAIIGFNSTYYFVVEDEGSVSVCIQLCEGSTNRPIDVLLYTSDSSALAGTNYEQTVGIVTIPALAVAGDVACTEITILNDGIVTDVLTFYLAISIADTHVIIADAKADATVHITPPFEICFDMDTPRVNGSELFLSFYASDDVANATCSVDSLPTQDCTNGYAIFTFTNAGRTQPYDIVITAFSNSGEIRTLENNVRSELPGICDTHLVNKGVIFDGNNATVNVQPTGPNQISRVVDLECRCSPNEADYSPCPTGLTSESDAVSFVYTIPDGCTRLTVRQNNSGGSCRPRRALPIDIPVSE